MHSYSPLWVVFKKSGFGLNFDIFKIHIELKYDSSNLRQKQEYEISRRETTNKHTRFILVATGSGLAEDVGSRTGYLSYSDRDDVGF